MCRLLGVSTSGFYAWLKRPESARARRDAELAERIEGIHMRSRRTYGAPRIHAELRAEGEQVGRKLVARLMKARGLEGASRRKGCRTTARDDRTRPAPDLVEREFTAEAPDRLWVADITYIPTREGFLYLAVVLDVFSRRIVGWAMAAHLRTELVLSALDMALWQRQPDEVVHHSDQGCQYTSLAFSRRCEEAGVRPSMGSVGDCFDNAMAESFFATLECELLDRSTFRTRAEAERALFEFIEGWYNSHRRHSALGNLSPINFERQHAQRKGGVQAPNVELSTEPGNSGNPGQISFGEHDSHPDFWYFCHIFGLRPGDAGKRHGSRKRGRTMCHCKESGNARDRGSFFTAPHVPEGVCHENREASCPGALAGSFTAVFPFHHRVQARRCRPCRAGRHRRRSLDRGDADRRWGLERGSGAR